MKKFLIFLLFLIAIIYGLSSPKIQKVIAQVPGSGCPSTTAIGSLACSMPPGTWVQVPNSAMNNWGGGNDILSPPNGASITEFSDKMLWNSVRHKAMFLGGSHHPNTVNCDGTAFVGFTDSTNTWANISPSPCPNFSMSFSPSNWGHTYENEAIELTTGNMFIRQYGGGAFSVFNNVNQTWASLPASNIALGFACSSGNCEFGGLTWFPDRNSLIAADGLIGIQECKYSGTNSNGVPCGGGTGQVASNWNTIACFFGWGTFCSTNNWATYPAMNGGNTQNCSDSASSPTCYDQRAQYSPLCKCVIFTGGEGSEAMVKMTAAGTTSALSNSPFGHDINGDDVMVLDPSSGRFVFVEGSNCHTWIYDPVKDSYTDTGVLSTNCPVAEGQTAQTVATPIPEYGVDMFMYYGSSNSGNGTVYLYKAYSVPDGDWIMRSEQAAVFMANPLSTSSNLGTTTWGSNFGRCCAGSTDMAIDGTTYLANGGSMVCDVPAPTTGDDPCADFFQNFGPTNGATYFIDTTTCNADPTHCLGNSFYIQMELYLPTAYFADEPTNGEGQKNFIIGAGDPSTCNPSSTGTCTSSCGTNNDDEIVMLNNSYRGNPTGGVPQLYQNCGTFSPMEVVDPGIPGNTWATPNYLIQNLRNECWHYPNTNPANMYYPLGSTFFSPNMNCVNYGTNSWWSLEMQVTLGAYNNTDHSYDNSVVNMWGTTVGSSYTQAFNYTLNILDDYHNGYGKIWLLTYNTAATHWTGGYPIRWTQLIGSTAFIAAPQTSTPSAPSTTAPFGMAGNAKLGGKVTF